MKTSQITAVLLSSTRYYAHDSGLHRLLLVVLFGGTNLSPLHKGSRTGNRAADLL